MQQKTLIQIVFGGITILILGAVIIIGINSWFGNNNNNPTSLNKTNALGVAAATASPVPLPTNEGIVIITPSVAPGQPITHPGFKTGPQITLFATNLAPQIKVEEAKQAVYDRGVIWALDSQNQGKPISLSAVFGLATVGQAGDTSQIKLPDGSSPSGNCKDWLGPCNYPIQQCVKGICKDTGRVISRIENRPIWILDFSNTPTPFYGSQTSYNHTIYAVDCQEKVVLYVWGYNA